jgi:hypothetical protein
MIDGICRFCNKQAKLVKSHIIPFKLYWQLVDENGNIAKLLSPYDDEHPKRRSNGFYDYFLCDEHEKQFNVVDNYACELLRDSVPKEMNNGWEFTNVNYKLIKLFFISMLWRAHWATNSFFQKIDLGPHEKRIKHLIENQDPSDNDEFSVVLWRSDELIAKALREPYPERYEGVSYVRFYLPGYMALIKVDKRRLDEKFSVNSLNNNGFWFVAKKIFKGSPEEKSMIELYKKNREKYNLRTKRSS